MSRRWDTTVIPQAENLAASHGKCHFHAIIEVWKGFKIDGTSHFDQIFTVYTFFLNITFAGHGQDSTSGRATGHGIEKVRCMPPSGD